MPSKFLGHPMIFLEHKFNLLLENVTFHDAVSIIRDIIVTARPCPYIVTFMFVND